jgi:hypothetical protein
MGWRLSLCNRSERLCRQDERCVLWIQLVALLEGFACYPVLVAVRFHPILHLEHAA